MELGTTLPTWCTDAGCVPAETIRRFASRAEAAGLAGLWTLDHLVRTPIYDAGMLDPIVALSHAAAVTEHVDLGTSILILPLRRTANVASRAATLQHLSDGRLVLGLGAGYVPAEFEAVGVPRHERGPRFSEGLEVLQALLAGETSFEGRFHSFEDVRIEPVSAKPPRLLAGGSVENPEAGEWAMPEPVLERILDAGGWIAPPCRPEQAATGWETVRKYAEAQGVDPADLEFVLLNYAHLVEDPESAHDRQREVFGNFYADDAAVMDFERAREHCLVGSIQEVLGRIEAFESAGVDHLIAGAIATDPADLDEQVDLFEDRILPEVH